MNQCKEYKLEINSLNKKSERNSSIELLKIIAIIMIVISHSIPSTNYMPYSEISLNLQVSSANMQNILFTLLSHFGQIGNAIFIVCSSYFLIDKKNVKVKKIRDIIVDTIMISLFCLVIGILLKFKPTVVEIQQQLFPILNNNNWFIGCYLLFYIIHPFLNMIIKNVNQQQLLSINIFNIIIYCIANLLKGESYYFNPLIGFIVIYFIVAYVKLYLKNVSKSKKINLIILITSIISLISIILLTNYLGLHRNFYTTRIQHWNRINNPLIILIGITSFNLLSQKKFNNKFINYISSLSLLIYLISENLFLKKRFFIILFAYIYYYLSYEHIVLYTIVLSIATFIISVIIATIYKETIGKTVKEIFDIIFKYIEKGYLYITNKLLEIN